MLALALISVVGGVLGVSAIWFTNKQVNNVKDLVGWFVPQSSFTYIIIIIIIVAAVYFSMRKKLKMIGAVMLLPLCIAIIGLEKTVIRDLRVGQVTEESNKFETNTSKKSKGLLQQVTEINPIVAVGSIFGAIVNGAKKIVGNVVEKVSPKKEEQIEEEKKEKKKDT